MPAAADFGREPLADDPAQRIGEADAELLLFAGSNMPRMRLMVSPALTGVQGAQNQVAGFRRAQGDFDRVAVAHFADENDLGRLAQGGAQAVGIVVEIMPSSRWLKVALLCGWTNSTGSSSVTMWTALVSLISFRMAASVVDLPEPVAPVTSTSPFFPWGFP